MTADVDIAERSVYVISDKAGRQKIGMSIYPDFRWAELSKSDIARGPLTLAFHVQRSGVASRAIERLAHRKLDRHALGREWFDVGVQDAIDAVSGAADEVDSGSLIAAAPNEPMNFKMPPAFNREFRIVAADRGLRLNELLVDAFEVWKQRRA